MLESLLYVIYIVFEVFCFTFRTYSNLAMNHSPQKSIRCFEEIIITSLQRGPTVVALLI
jgi:hypothetical protein